MDPADKMSELDETLAQKHYRISYKTLRFFSFSDWSVFLYLRRGQITLNPNLNISYFVLITDCHCRHGGPAGRDGPHLRYQLLLQRHG